jgi:hypothetical protein
MDENYIGPSELSKALTPFVIFGCIENFRNPSGKTCDTKGWEQVKNNFFAEVIANNTVG